MSSNEQICPVEEQEGSFPWKSLSPEWLPKISRVVFSLYDIVEIIITNGGIFPYIIESKALGYFQDKKAK